MFFLESAVILFTGTFLLTYLTIPKIIGVVEYKRLMDDPDHRSSHSTKTPTLGGISFFFALMIALFFISIWQGTNDATYIIPGLSILLIVGLKDDLVVLSPGAKLISQVFAIGFLVANPAFTITSLNGFLNVFDIPFALYLLIAVFLMIIIINSFNLIDGIDGLASVVGIIIMIIYTTIFYLAQEYFFSLLAISMNGCLISFFGFNISSDKKIFMGDTGSMITGFLIGVLTLKFLSLDEASYDQLPFLLENAPLIAICILIVPLFDTARVFAVRIANKKGPFRPDRNHIHHVLIDYWGLSHKQASFIIGMFNIGFVMLFIILGSRAKNLLMVSALALVVLVLGYVFFWYNYNFTALKGKVRVKKFLRSIKNLFRF